MLAKTEVTSPAARFAISVRNLLLNENEEPIWFKRSVKDENSRKLHLEIGSYAEEKNVDLVLGVGPLGCIIADAAGARGIAFENKEELKEGLEKYIEEGDTVLVKASRGMALDEIVEFLMD